jgi:hypothetical protein
MCTQLHYGVILRTLLFINYKKININVPSRSLRKIRMVYTCVRLMFRCILQRNPGHRHFWHLALLTVGTTDTWHYWHVLLKLHYWQLALLIALLTVNTTDSWHYWHVLLTQHYWHVLLKWHYWQLALLIALLTVNATDSWHYWHMYYWHMVQR